MSSARKKNIQDIIVKARYEEKEEKEIRRNLLKQGFSHSEIDLSLTELNARGKLLKTGAIVLAIVFIPYGIYIFIVGNYWVVGLCLLMCLVGLSFHARSKLLYRTSE